MTNIDFHVPLVYKVVLFGLKLNIIATIFLVVEEGVQTFWLSSSHLRCPLNLLEIFSRKLFWGAIRPFLAAARCITDITDISITRPNRGYHTTHHPPSALNLKTIIQPRPLYSVIRIYIFFNLSNETVEKGWKGPLIQLTKISPFFNEPTLESWEECFAVLL